MLEAVKELHACNLVHRDIKPGNFCLGLDADADTVYLVDFGFVLPLPTKVLLSWVSGKAPTGGANAVHGWIRLTAALEEKRWLLLLQRETLGTEKFCGTPDFASSNALRGGKCGAKDDCESLCYGYMQLWNCEESPCRAGSACSEVGWRLC